MAEELEPIITKKELMIETITFSDLDGYQPVPIHIDWSQAPEGYNWWCWDFVQQVFTLTEPTFVKGGWYFFKYKHIVFDKPPVGFDIRLLKRRRPSE